MGGCWKGIKRKKRRSKVHSEEYSSSEVTENEYPNCRWISLWVFVIFLHLLVVMMYYRPWDNNTSNESNVLTACGIDLTEEIYLGEYILRFESPMTQAPSLSSIECSWKFKTKQYHRINMVIEKFKPNSRYDILQIFDGPSVQMYPTNATLDVNRDSISGSLPLDILNSSSNEILVHLNVQNISEISSFEIHFTSVSCMMKCENNDKVPVCGSNGVRYENQCELNATSCLSGHIVDKDRSRPLLYTLHEGNCTDMTCSNWSGGFPMVCSRTVDEASITIDRNVTAIEKEKCKSLCQNLGMHGCCFVSDKAGCHFKPGAYATIAFDKLAIFATNHHALNCFPKDSCGEHCRCKDGANQLFGQHLNEKGYCEFQCHNGYCKKGVEELGAIINCTACTIPKTRANKIDCEFSPGRGRGYKFSRIKMPEVRNREECVDRVMKEQPNANAASFHHIGLPICIAEFDVTTTADEKDDWETCIFRDWTLVAEEEDCKGSEIHAGRFLNATECASACKAKSSMFIFGFGTKCNYKGCNCWCKTDTFDNGTCHTNGIKDYNLYRYLFPEPDPGCFHCQTRNEKGKCVRKSSNSSLCVNDIDGTVCIRNNETQEHCEYEACYTVGGPDPYKQCKFPFIYGERVYYGCAIGVNSNLTFVDFFKNPDWCSTEVDALGNHISGKGYYGHCNSECQSQVDLHYDSSSESFGYVCTWNTCNWAEYENDTDYGYYLNANGSCSHCMRLCDLDQYCEGIECGFDYCSWWKNGKCQKPQEYSLKNTRPIKTCLKFGYQFLSTNSNLNLSSSENNSVSVVNKAEMGCICKDLVNQQGYGNCKFKSPYLSQSFQEFCYVHLPSNCSDLISSRSILGEKFSAEACNLQGTQCSAVQILREEASHGFSNKIENAKLFGRYLLIGQDSNGNNVYRKNDQSDTYYVSADGNNTHWMVDKELHPEYPDLKNDKCFYKSSPDKCENAWLYADYSKQTIENSSVSIHCDDSECCDSVRLVSSGYMARKGNYFLGNYIRIKSQNPSGYSTYQKQQGGLLWLVFNGKLGKWMITNWNGIHCLASPQYWEDESKCTFDLAIHYQFCNYKCPEACFQPFGPNDLSVQVECAHDFQSNNLTCDPDWQYECPNQFCIPGSYACNFVRDCEDGSDETVELCSNRKCKDSTEYRCKSGQCISNALRCDKRFDCADKSDEEDCNHDKCNGGDIAVTKECCTKDFPCADGEGNCVVDNQCIDDLICGAFNCNESFPSFTACCTRKSVSSCHGGAVSEFGCCTEELPCGVGEGSCNPNNYNRDCEQGLICGYKNCDPNFFSSDANCCAGVKCGKYGNSWSCTGCLEKYGIDSCYGEHCGLVAYNDSKLECEPKVSFDDGLSGSWNTYGELKINISQPNAPVDMYVVNQSAVATCYRIAPIFDYSLRNAPIKCKLENYLITGGNTTTTKSVNKILSRLGVIQKQELGYIVLFDTDGQKRSPFYLTSYWNHLLAFQGDTFEFQPTYEVKNWALIGPWTCPDAFEYQPVQAGFRKEGIEIKLESVPYLNLNITSGKLESALQSIDIQLSAKGFDTDQNSISISKVGQISNMLRVVLENYTVGAQYDVDVVFRMKNSSLTCPKMTTKLDTSFTSCENFRTQDDFANDTQNIQKIKIDELCDGKLDCDNDYDESDDLCRGNTIVYLIAFGGILLLYVIIGFPSYYYVKRIYPLNMDYNITLNPKNVFSAEINLIVSFSKIRLKDSATSLNKEAIMNLKQYLMLCMRDLKTRNLLQLIYVLSLHAPFLDVCYAFIDQFMSGEAAIHNSSGEAMECLLFCEGEDSYISGFIRDAYERHDFFSRTKKWIMNCLKSLLFCAKSTVLYLEVTLNFFLCITKVSLFYYDMIKDLLTLGTYLHIANNILVKTNPEIRYATVGGINMLSLFVYSSMILIINIASIHVFVYKRRNMFAKILRVNTNEKFTQWMISIFPLQTILLEDCNVSNNILLLEQELSKIATEEINENEELTENAAKKVLEISQELDMCYRQKYHINILYNEIEMVESLSERQFQTVVFTMLMVFSNHFKRITIVFEASLGISMETFLILNWCITVFGFINSFIKYKNAKKFPVEPGVGGKIIQFLSFTVLAVFKFLLVTVAVGNAPHFHLLGYGIELVFIWICNRFVFDQESNLETSFVTAMLAASFKPPDLGIGKRCVLFGRYDPHGGIINTVILELFTLVIYMVIGLVLRSYGLLNPILISASNDGSRESSNFLDFGSLMIRFNLESTIMFCLFVVAIYPLIMMLYHRFGHPYKMKFETDETIKPVDFDMLDPEEETEEGIEISSSRSMNFSIRNEDQTYLKQQETLFRNDDNNT